MIELNKTVLTVNVLKEMFFVVVDIQYCLV